MTQLTQEVLKRTLSLTLADLSCVGERIFHSAPDVAWNFDTISARPRHERNLVTPDFAANCGDRIAERGDCFLIPRSCFWLEGF
jgi:hypothetical protein